MSDDADDGTRPEWDLGDWEEALSIHVGDAYGCRQCGNLVMVTKGGTGVLQLGCCGRPMEKLHGSGAGEGRR